ncbi:hypothetical protein F2P56_031877 [Juglans regia]|uniref:Lysosomal Pro-X carboxypeptidase-like n=2 Tax=Juglans regia TaxID=51240 RepID=A0A2I4H9X0_JUGRE|nr:lysosomal Pro-X carboxypeptidase-like [Juglans regia]XP_035541250.1 lysosomal Pro-X carboxypeptidase-like [Juglans regia]KAF5446236.1 hypothetical protein F2P56_031878 [Juglans regia]KAF5446237.1 hypothetical protein F2P56_031876 [Juglans regia]KAF5446238.1 hypothetical protein F2P56_031877 [Juglans regia]
MDMAIPAPRSRALRTLSWLLLISLCITLSDSASLQGSRPRLGVRRGHNKQKGDLFGQSLAASFDYVNHDYQTFYYDQTLDHFNYQPQSYATFQQRYVVNFKHWRGAHAAAPILVYLGDEATIEEDVGAIGFMLDNVGPLGALEVYIEHRFYGKSIPFGLPREEAWKNATLRGYFNSAQALADHAEIILHLKKNLSAEASPVIVCGGSYGGMLAAWFRLKYPHIAIGALASSAPILYFDNLTPSNAYYTTVTDDFKEASVSCYNTIKQSWAEITKIAAKPNGLSILSNKFNTCKPLKNRTELLDYLVNLYSVSAQYDSPPDYPVNRVCKGIDNGSQGTDILGRIVSGIVAFGGGQKKKCNDLADFYSSETLGGWDWQTCSELVQPIGCGANDTMFYAQPFYFNEYKDYCVKKFGVVPRPHWITTHYGGHNIKMVLKKFGSNIIFSNGLRDPFSRAGVLENISDSIVALYTKEGSHCLDIMSSTKDAPDWLVAQRKKEAEIINGWIHKYYEDLHMISSSS